VADLQLPCRAHSMPLFAPTNLFKKNLQEKKVTKNAIGYGSFRIGQFFHRRYDKNTNHPSIQQSLQEKKVVKNGTSCGSFRTSQFCHKKHNTNIDHLSIQQKLQEKKVVKSVINCGLFITS
jgi:hypothetical protein